MKFSLSCLLTLVTIGFFSFSLFSQIPHTPTVEVTDLQASTAPPIRVLPSQSLIWEISGNGLQKPSYIYAIMSKVPEDFFFLPSGLDPLIQQADKWMMEVNPMELDVDHLYRGGVPIDSSLTHLLSRKSYASLEKFVKDSLSVLSSYKLDNRYSPVLLAQQFLCDYCLGFRYGDEPIDYERYLYLAIGEKKPLKTIEGDWSRITRTDGLSYKTQAEFLEQSLKSRKKLCKNYKEMLLAYRASNLDQVWLLAHNSPELGDYSNHMKEARTEAWLKSISWLMKYESLFMAIQAPILPGEYGLLHQLRKAGFVVKPHNP